MTDKVKENVEDVMTGILHTMVYGMITGVLVDFDEDGQKYYGLRIRKFVPHAKKEPCKEYALWFLRDEEDNGPGCFQIQEIKPKIKEELSQN